MGELQYACSLHSEKSATLDACRADCNLDSTGLEDVEVCFLSPIFLMTVLLVEVKLVKFLICLTLLLLVAVRETNIFQSSMIPNKRKWPDSLQSCADVGNSIKFDCNRIGFDGTMVFSQEPCSCLLPTMVVGFVAVLKSKPLPQFIQMCSGSWL